MKWPPLQYAQTTASLTGEYVHSIPGTGCGSSEKVVPPSLEWSRSNPTAGPSGVRWAFITQTERPCTASPPLTAVPAGSTAHSSLEGLVVQIAGVGFDGHDAAWQTSSTTAYTFPSPGSSESTVPGSEMRFQVRPPSCVAYSSGPNAQPSSASANRT